jgi:hypothetical protein
MATVNLSPLFNGQTMFNGNLPLAGGKIYTYQAGSSTPLTTYTTVNGTIAQANPIVLNSTGKLSSELWLLYGYSYKFVLEDASSNVINTYDNIAGIITSIPATAPTLPTGVILIWSGSTGSIPSGYVICDGTNGTPDLRNSFVVGAGSTYAVAATGGTADAVVVTHTHTATVTDPGHTHTGSYLSGTPASSGFGPTTTAPAQFSNPISIPTATTGITVANTSTGVSGTNANLPPYYALAYIMKT